jgi:hypothetical protein
VLRASRSDDAHFGSTLVLSPRLCDPLLGSSHSDLDHYTPITQLVRSCLVQGILCLASGPLQQDHPSTAVSAYLEIVDVWDLILVLEVVLGVDRDPRDDTAGGHPATLQGLVAHDFDAYSMLVPVEESMVHNCWDLDLCIRSSN